MEAGRSIRKEFLTVKELSGYVALKPATVYELAKHAEIPFYRLHKMIRFRRQEIDAWMENHRGCGNLYKVQVLLGHKGKAMTQRYAHHYPESLRDTVEILDQLGNSTNLSQVVGDNAATI